MAAFMLTATMSLYDGFLRSTYHENITSFRPLQWKHQPVVGTCVTGLQMQIKHGSNGFLVDDTETAAAYTLKLLQDRDLWRELGVNAYETVRQRFLFPTMILDYLKALERAQTGSSALVELERIPITTSAASKELVA